MGIVVSGAFATEVSAEDGRCFSTFVARSGNVLNLIRLVEGEPGPDTLLGGGHSAYAIVDSSVGLIPVDVVNGLCETNAHLSRLFFERAINRLRTVSDWFEKSKSLDARDRVKMLLDTLKEAGVDPSEVSHAMMGRMLGMNRVTVTRAMADVLDKSPSQ